MTQLSTILTAFATETGKDIKQLNQQVEQLKQQIKTAGISENQAQTLITQAITNLKNELMGGELDSHLDTLKELGDKLKELENSPEIKAAILQKFTEISENLTACQSEITAQKATLQALAGVDLLAVQPKHRLHFP